MEPSWYRRAKTFIDVAEIKGAHHNPVVLGFWKSAHLGFKDDETPWCSGFACAQLEEMGIRSPRSGMAKSFLNWGVKLSKPVKGCIVVLHRPPNPNSGHVGFFDSIVVHKGKRYVKLLGGNQSDKVCYAIFAEDKVAGYRWPKGISVTTGQPEVERIDNIGPAHQGDDGGGFVVDKPKVGAGESVTPSPKPVPRSSSKPPPKPKPQPLPPSQKATVTGGLLAAAALVMKWWWLVIPFGIAAGVGYYLYRRSGKE